MDAHDTSRNVLRRQCVDRRLALSPDEHARLSANICARLREHFPQLSAKRVAFCWPINNEPDLRPLIESWIDAQAELANRANPANPANPAFMALLPVVRAPRAPLGFRAWTPGCGMVIDSYGIPTPSSGEFIKPEALLIPVNAFDAAGYRIGYGGGYFDRTLALLGRDVLSIGVGFELARVDSIHPHAHDVPLDAIVSEAGVFRRA
jgi:5-formyltetrahydrofolate cyclo-ligase